MTLLEAVLALAILTTVLVVCLDLRARMLRHTVSLQRSQLIDREAQNLFVMVSSRSIDEPRVDKEDRAYIWEGDHLGSYYTITARPVNLPSPIAENADKAAPQTVPMWRYELEYMGETVEFLSY